MNYYALLNVMLWTYYDAACGQALVGSVTIVGSPDGGTRPKAMRIHPSGTTIIVANRYSLSRMAVSNLNSTVLAGSPVQSGYADDSGGDARFGEISDLAISKDGSWVYVADEENHCVRKVSIPAAPGTGRVTTFVGANVSGDIVGPIAASRLSKPSAICVSPDGTFLYIADRETNRLIKVNISSEFASYVPNALLSNPLGVAVGLDLSLLYVSTSNNGVFKVNVQTGATSALDYASQNGQAIYVSGSDKYLFVTDATWRAIRVIDLLRGGSRWICSPSNGPNTGTDITAGTLDTCRLGLPLGMAAVSPTSLYISDGQLPMIVSLTYNDNFELTTKPITFAPTTTTSTPPPFVPPAVPTLKVLSTTAKTKIDDNVAGNSTQPAATVAGSDATSQAVPLGVGISVALLVAVAFGLCIFFAVRDYKKNKDNPTTPFSRAVSFAVRSFRNSFGRGRFRHDGRQPLAESNGSLASNSHANFDDLQRNGRPSAERGAQRYSAAARQPHASTGVSSNAAGRDRASSGLPSSQDEHRLQAPQPGSRNGSDTRSITRQLQGPQQYASLGAVIDPQQYASLGAVTDPPINARVQQNSPASAGQQRPESLPVRSSVGGYMPEERVGPGALARRDDQLLSPSHRQQVPGRMALASPSSAEQQPPVNYPAAGDPLGVESIGQRGVRPYKASTQSEKRPNQAGQLASAGQSQGRNPVSLYGIGEPSRGDMATSPLSQLSDARTTSYQQNRQHGYPPSRGGGLPPIRPYESAPSDGLGAPGSARRSEPPTGGRSINV